ncbi:MAG: energy transducer TonB [Rhodospirillales bacterium]|nr:energy transducer TonB [Rhodospirillales bacterium]
MYTNNSKSIAGWTVAAVLLHGAVAAAIWRLPSVLVSSGRALPVFEMVDIPAPRSAPPQDDPPLAQPDPAPPAPRPPEPPVAVARPAAPAPEAISAPPPPKPPAPERPPERSARAPAPPSPEVRKPVEPVAAPRMAGSAAVAPPSVRAEPMEPVFVPADASAAYLRNPPPVYPLAARRRGLQGVVVLTVEVDAEGRPGLVTVRKSAGHALLDGSAVAAVRGWRFVPATSGGRPVASTVEVPVRFKLGE